jgi:hypothetical protein
MGSRHQRAAGRLQNPVHTFLSWVPSLEARGTAPRTVPQDQQHLCMPQVERSSPSSRPFLPIG